MKVALLGFGTVGKSVYNLLLQRFPEFEIKYVLVKDIDKKRNVKTLVIDDFSTVLQDEEIECVIEVIGDYEIVYEYIKQSLIMKKHVITANKAIISRHFVELNELARKNQVKLGFEASVAAATIIVDPLINLCKVNNITSIEGIINGSTNYILSRIFKDDLSLQQAMIEAINKGYIETGTNDDLAGLDLMRKINILSMIAFNQEIKENQVSRMSLEYLDEGIVRFLKSRQLEIKYLASAKKYKDIIRIHLEPVVFPKNHFFLQYNYEDNVVIVEGEFHKRLIFGGRGAGGDETASAIIYDLLKINERNYFSFKENIKVNNEVDKFVWLQKENHNYTCSEPMTISAMLKHQSCMGIRVDSSAIIYINKE